MKTHSEAFLRRRRFLLVLPLLIFPFLTLAFWALGGGTQAAIGITRSENLQGLSLKLPDPQFKEEKSPDKLTLYNQAKRSLQKQKESYKGTILNNLGFTNDGNSEVEGSFSSNKLLPAPESTPPVAAAGNILAGPLLHVDRNEEKVNQRLAQLSSLVNTKSGLPGPKSKDSAPTTRKLHDERFRQDVDKLEAMMRTMGGGSAIDPEMRQMENMLERILDIQHPERVKEKLREQSPEEQKQVFAVQYLPDQADITLLEPYSPVSISTPSGPPTVRAHQDEAPYGFYTLEEAPDTEEEKGNVIQAAVHETQTLTSGALVKVRLLQDMYINGTRVEKGSLLYGSCRVNGERLAIEFTSVLTQNTVLPVRLAAYDLDGLPGLHIPGAATREAAKQGADRAISQTMQLPTISSSMGVQAASAGIEATKSLLSRQARQVKVTVEAGYRLLLRDQKAHL